MVEPQFDPVVVGHDIDALEPRIAHAGGHDVRIVAVTKGFGAEAVRVALDAGLDDLGENYRAGAGGQSWSARSS